MVINTMESMKSFRSMKHMDHGIQVDIGKQVEFFAKLILV